MTYCGFDPCRDCARSAACGGCEQCHGHPFGGSCVAEQSENFQKLKAQLTEEINALAIDGLAVGELFLLSGDYINLPYPLADGTTVRFLNDRDVYLGAQVEKPGSERCLGVAANERFILVCEYGCNGADPELILYKRR